MTALPLLLKKGLACCTRLTDAPI